MRDVRPPDPPTGPPWGAARQTLRKCVRTLSRGTSVLDGGPVDRPGVEWLDSRPQQIMTLSAGTRLGHYDVTALLGEGGMGQVWQATDTQLGRQVALKILPDAFAADPDRLARFTREAQILASLNHPNIAAIYGIEEAEGTRALVLELVEGPTLADRISKGPIPLDEALPIAKQIAEALEAAHEAGVIHRDLKPANIKVREDGTVKVLDFGLAKALDPSPDADPSQSPTLTAAATQMGVIMGTAAYMSPEQARGKRLDRRSDIWAFGCVLFEMLTGQRAFESEDVSLTLADVMRAEPAWGRLPQELPPVLGTFLERCLEKDARRRVRDIGDVRLAMEGAFEQADRGRNEVGSRVTWQRPLPLVVAAGGLVLVGALLGRSVIGTGSRGLAPPVRLTVALPGSDVLANATLDAVRGGYPTVSLSPDGRMLVYAAVSDGVQQLYRRPLGQLTSTAIPGTEGASRSFFSPDGESIGFVVGRTLKKTSIDGGDPLVVAETRDGITGASWGPDDTIIVSTSGSSPLSRMSASGGDVEEFTKLGADIGHLNPQFLPGGRGVLFNSRNTPRTVFLFSTETGEQTPLTEGLYPQYVSTGHLIFARGTSLWAMPFDLDGLVVTGEAVRLLDGIVGPASVSRDGTLAYLAGAPPVVRLVWVDRDGEEEATAGIKPGLYSDLVLSPDGGRIALSVASELAAPENIWVFDITRRALTQITTGPGASIWPLWSPDGDEIVFSARRDGDPNRNIFRRAADGTGVDERLTTSPLSPFPWGWSSDETMLVIMANLGVDTGPDILATSLDTGKEVPIVETPFRDMSPDISPDGGWIAYTSGGEVYVSPFPDASEFRRRASTNGGRVPKWSSDGRTLFYRAGDAVMAVSIETEPSLTVGAPDVFTVGEYVELNSRKDWDVAPDGRFLMMKESLAAPSITVVLNWTQELLERVPVP